METLAKLSGAEFDRMVERGAFDFVNPKKVELIRGGLRFMNPAGPIHDDYIEYLTRWSVSSAGDAAAIRVQSGLVCDDNRPEPDIVWLKPRRYGPTRPTAADVLLLIEVADSSLLMDLREKADLYAEAGVLEYWVIDVQGSRLHRMSDSDGRTFRGVEVVVPPTTPSPACRPSARLDLAELFSVK